MRFLRALWKSVGRRQIRDYLLVPITAAILLSVLVPWPEARVALFAIAVFLWSLYFPTRTEMKDQRSAVDFWYYLLGIIGVVVFFLAGGLDREKLHLRQDYESETAQYLAAKERGELLRAAATDAVGIDQTMRQLAEARAAGAARSQESCQDAMRVDLQNRIERRYDVDPFAPSHGQGALPELFDPTAICLVAIEQIQWQEIATAATPSERIKLILKYGLGDTYPVAIGGRTGSVADFGQYLSIDPASDAWRAAVKEADDQATIARLAANASGDAYDRLGKIGGPFSRSNVDFLAKLIWPFLLITALGLKLARDPFALPKKG